jgi:hypothetical protein
VAAPDSQKPRTISRRPVETERSPEPEHLAADSFGQDALDSSGWTVATRHDPLAQPATGGTASRQDVPAQTEVSAAAAAPGHEHLSDPGASDRTVLPLRVRVAGDVRSLEGSRFEERGNLPQTPSSRTAPHLAVRTPALPNTPPGSLDTGDAGSPDRPAPSFAVAKDRLVAPARSGMVSAAEDAAVAPAHSVIVPARAVRPPSGGPAANTPAGPRRGDREPPAIAVPTIQVTIGRVDVRAATPPPQPTIARPSVHTMSLEDYLRRRVTRGADE